MMALFIVLWLLNTSKPVREAIAGYFRDPAGTEGKLGTSSSGPGAQVVVADDMGKVKDQIEKAMQKMPNFDELKEHIEIKVTAEGLRIELLESASGTFFDLVKPDPNENGKELLDLLAGQLGKLPTRFPSTATPTRSPSAENAITAIGNSQPTGPTPAAYAAAGTR
jgi:chemotaxis protein MotB